MAGSMFAPSARIFQEVLYRVLEAGEFPTVHRNGRERVRLATEAVCVGHGVTSYTLNNPARAMPEGCRLGSDVARRQSFAASR